MAEQDKPAPRQAATNDPDRVSRALAQAQREAEERQADETVPGGRYRTAAGDLVDAEGQPLKKKD
jgi:hypothetical protein